MALQLECEKCGESYSDVELLWIDSEGSTGSGNSGLLCEHCVNKLIEDLRSQVADQGWRLTEGR